MEGQVTSLIDTLHHKFCTSMLLDQLLAVVFMVTCDVNIYQQTYDSLVLDTIIVYLIKN